MSTHSLETIRLTATESNWRLFMVRKADPAFLAFQNKVLQRDDYTCRYCGFRAMEYQEIVNRDGNYYNNRSVNLLTACSFCAQCFFLEVIGKSDFGGGSLIFLPEMSQGELNALCHVLFHAIISGSSQSNDAKNIYRSLRLRSQIVEKEMGEGMSNPGLYGQLLLDSRDMETTIAGSAVASKLRLLPNLNRFTEQLETWTVSALKTLMKY